MFRLTTWMVLVLFTIACSEESSFTSKAQRNGPTKEEKVDFTNADAQPALEVQDEGEFDEVDAPAEEEDTQEDYIQISEDELASLCASAQAKAATQQVLFPKPQATCEWGQNDNLAFDRNAQLVITARREQKVNLSLPKGALICEMNFAFMQQEMRYDDEIILTFDDVILASSQDYSNPGEFEMKDGFYRYDWKKILADPYPINDRNQFFIDSDCGADCLIPPTQTNGTMKLKIQPETVRKLSLAAGVGYLNDDNKVEGQLDPEATHYFQFVTTGDNDDPIDCMHEDFKFDVSIKYVVVGGDND